MAKIYQEPCDKSETVDRQGLVARFGPLAAKVVERMAVMGAGALGTGSFAVWLVTTFATASTGTAIVFLKGAALTSAALAALASTGGAGAIIAYRKWRGPDLNTGDKIAMVIPGGIELFELAVDQLGKLPEPSVENYQKLRDTMIRAARRWRHWNPPESVERDCNGSGHLAMPLHGDRDLRLIHDRH